MKKNLLLLLILILSFDLIANPILVYEVTRFEKIGLVTSLVYLIATFMIAANVEIILIGVFLRKWSKINRSKYWQLLLLNLFTFIPTQLLAFYISSPSYLGKYDYLPTVELIPFFIEPYVVYKIVTADEINKVTFKKIILTVLVVNFASFIAGAVLNEYLNYVVAFR